MTVAEYFEARDQQERAAYDRVRAIILDIAPDAVETISYSMPTLKYKGKALMHFGAFKDHMSLFPASTAVIVGMADELKDYKVAKGTLQFTADKPIPDALIRKMVHTRLKEIA